MGKGMSHEYLTYARLFIDLKNRTSFLLLLSTSWNSRKTYEELNMLLPFSADIKVQQTQRE